MFVRCLAGNLELLLFFFFNLYYCEILHIEGNAIIFCCRYQPVCILQLFSPQSLLQAQPSFSMLPGCGVFFLPLTAHRERWTQTRLCVNTTFLCVMFWGLLSGIGHLKIIRVTQNNGVKKQISQTWAMSVFRITAESRRGHYEYHTELRITTSGKIALFRIDHVGHRLKFVSSLSWGRCRVSTHQCPIL